MEPGHPHEHHIERLRRWRNHTPPDLTLQFMRDWFKREYSRPHKQVAQFADLWQQFVPARLLPQTALASFARGVLTIAVADSSTLYELDQLLRSGLEAQLRSAAQAPLRRIKLQLAPVDLHG